MDGIEGLEKKCVEPGLWWVEGYQVRRVGTGNRARWLIVWQPGKMSEAVWSFREAQQRIVDVINNDGGGS